MSLLNTIKLSYFLPSLRQSSPDILTETRRPRFLSLQQLLQLSLSISLSVMASRRQGNVEETNSKGWLARRKAKRIVKSNNTR